MHSPNATAEEECLKSFGQENLNLRMKHATGQYRIELVWENDDIAKQKSDRGREFKIFEK
jgi:hypothetical protein